MGILLASVTATAAASAEITTSVSATIDATASTVPTGAIESFITSTVPSIIASSLPSVVTTTTPVTSSPILLPPMFEIAAIFAGAIAGGLVAVKRRYDAMGVLTLAIVNGLGGGMIRDALLQDQGVYALESPRALVTAVLAGFLTMFFFKPAERLQPILQLVDALSLALFALIGADKALMSGLGPIPAIMMGAITAVGGGLIRDIICNREPDALRPGSLYGTAAIVGSSMYVTLVLWLHFSKGWALFIAAFLTLALRMGSVWFGWMSPTPVDLTHRVLGRRPGTVTLPYEGESGVGESAEAPETPEKRD